MKLIFLASFLFQVIYSIETTILEYLTKTDQQTLIVANELFNVIESKRYFRQEQFTCLTLLPSNLTKNQVQKVYKLNVTYNYKHHETQPTQQSGTKIPSQLETQGQAVRQIVGVYEDYDYDKILELLHGTCAIHETNEFLYEYCHKEKVRQFDNMATYQRMAKQQYEDIAMGYFNYQDALKKSQSDFDKHLKSGKEMFKIKYSQNGDLIVINTLLNNFPELSDLQRQALAKTLNSNLKDTTGSTQTQEPKITVLTIPSRSVIYDKKNLFTVSDINHKDYDLNKEEKVIHLNYPIVRGNDYFTSYRYTHQVTCEYYFNDTKAIYVTKGVVISFFELAFIGNISMCHKVIDVSNSPIEAKPYESPFQINKLREYKDLLFGYVDDSCTNNWDWDINGNNDIKGKSNYLEPHNTLWIEMVSNVSGKLLSLYEAVTVKKIIAPGVVKIQQNIRKTLMDFKHSTVKSPKDSVWINSCRIISKKSIIKDSFNNLNIILRKNLIRIKKKLYSQSKKPGDQLLCLCAFKKQNDQFLQMQLTLGNKIFEPTIENQEYSYFEFYQKRTVKTINSQVNQLYQICSQINCFDFEKEKDEKNQEIRDKTNQFVNKNKFTQIHKFTSNQPILKENLQTENQIMIIDVSQKGMIKIHTEFEGDKYIYLISTSMLMKIRLFPNGTKQIVRQNSFYQNQTTYDYASWLRNSIFIHKNFIWRGYDKIVFPRMNMNQEKIISIQRMSGYAYLRKWDLSKMKHKDSFYLSTIKQRIEESFIVKKYPLYAKYQTISQKKETMAKVQEQKIRQQINKNDENVIEPVAVEQIKQEGEFLSVDFSRSQFKPLNKSVSVQYQYFHGDYCGQPHNRFRRTNVDMQCGEPWLKIQKVKEISPCIYELQVSTRLLCRQKFHKTVDKMESLNKNMDSRVKLEKGVVCYPEDAWDNALYVYDVGSRDVYLSLG